MRLATDAFSRGQWPKDQAIAAVTLDYDSRYRRRVRLMCQDGAPVLLNLAHAVVLRDGDGLRLTDGRWIAVHAAQEELVEISCDTPTQLLHLAWQLGNRHCPAEVHEDRLVIRHDRVITDLMRQMGAKIVTVHRAFDPEGGIRNIDHGHGVQ